MTHYTATVHLLFEVDEAEDSEATIADALSSILTDNMRKYGAPYSNLIDWSFAAKGSAPDCISAVAIAADYEPDVNPFPYPSIEPDMVAALQWLLDDMHDAGETHEASGNIFDSVGNAASALIHAGGKLGWFSAEDAKHYRLKCKAES